MRIIYFILFPFFLFNNLIAQTKLTSFLSSSILNSNDSIYNPQNEIVNTPFGPTLKSNVHFIDKKYHLNNKNGHVQIIQTNNGQVIREFDNDLKSKVILSKELFSHKNLTNYPSENSDGWITYAYGDVHVATPKLTYFSADWIVPSPPEKSSNQLLYLFNGLQGGNLNGLILQPVLQWGVSAAGGGNYWAISNWFVSGDSQFFYDSLIVVSPGTRLQGVIKLTSVSNNLFNYNSSFTGYSTGLQINNTSELTTTYIGLEAYNINGCDEYPADEKMKMFNIQILCDSIYPPLIWNTYDRITSCGQYTRIVSVCP